VPNTMPIPEAVEQAKKQTSGVTSSTVTST
jgi:hypothetical protein